MVAHDPGAERHDEAQALIDEAREVRATPDQTERLRASVAEQRAALEGQRGVVDELAEDERSLRTRTRGSRLALAAAALAVVAAIALVVFLATR